MTQYTIQVTAEQASILFDLVGQILQKGIAQKAPAPKSVAPAPVVSPPAPRKRGRAPGTKMTRKRKTVSNEKVLHELLEQSHEQANEG